MSVAYTGAADADIASLMQCVQADGRYEQPWLSTKLALDQDKLLVP